MHFSMFYATMQNMSSPEQWAKWGDKIKRHKILGCYAQTELGHGSNVMGLETTATFDHKTDEIVINSPTITSTKYWPGEMANSASHAVVFARLLVDGNDYSVQPFLV
jgi:acyl-CoA oxidase